MLGFRVMVISGCVTKIHGRKRGRHASENPDEDGGMDSFEQWSERMGYLGSCGPNSRKMMGKWMNSPGLNSSDFGLGTDLRKFLTAELMMVWSWENGEIVELKG